MKGGINMYLANEGKKSEVASAMANCACGGGGTAVQNNVRSLVCTCYCGSGYYYETNGVLNVGRNG